MVVYLVAVEVIIQRRLQLRNFTEISSNNEKKMARLKKSNAGACASNLPITRSQTVVSRASIVGAKAKTPAQAPPKSSSFRDSAGKKRYRPGSKALKEIRHYQRGI